MPVGLDWLHTILPATQAFLEGGNPYETNEGFRVILFPFWTFIALAPFAMLPYWIGRVLLFAVSLTCFTVTACKMGAERWQVILFLLSAPVIGCLNNGNIDWLVMMGLWMPPKIGLFFVLMKPQIGLGIALYWMYASWFVGGWVWVYRTLAPVLTAYLLSFIGYGFWIVDLSGMNVNPENLSAFPHTIFLAVILLYAAMEKPEKSLAIFSGPLLAPYVSQFSYAASLIALFSRKHLFLLAWVLLWIPVIVRYLR